jgi:hypothetical protein
VLPLSTSNAWVWTHIGVTGKGGRLHIKQRECVLPAVVFTNNSSHLYHPILVGLLPSAHWLGQYPEHPNAYSGIANFVGRQKYKCTARADLHQQA